MNLESILSFIQDARTQLSLLGIGPTTLIVVGVLGLICFVFSMREVLGWYLRTHEMRDEIRALRAEIAELKKTLVQDSDATIKLEPVTQPPKFRLDH